MACTTLTNCSLKRFKVEDFPTLYLKDFFLKSSLLCVCISELHESLGFRIDKVHYETHTHRRGIGPADEVIEGLDLAVMKMKPGEVAEVTIAPRYAYKDQTFEGPLAVVPEGATLVYTVELVSMNKVGMVRCWYRMWLCRMGGEWYQCRCLWLLQGCSEALAFHQG